MAVIGISGKIGSGKDTIGKIIQYLVNQYENNNRGFGGITCLEFLEQYKFELLSVSFNIKKFADSLKDMICIMINCTREQLEDENFKNTELSEEWWYYKEIDSGLQHSKYTPLIPYNTEFLNDGRKKLESKGKIQLIKPTPRMLMQLLGTECGRNILHPNLWVNSLFSKYKIQSHKGFTRDLKYPNWIITDMRFPNELEAVKKRNGITIRVNRQIIKYSNNISYVFNPLLDNKHPSETALDKANFDYIIDNNGTIEELIEQIREILTKENLIKDD